MQHHHTTFQHRQAWNAIRWHDCIPYVSGGLLGIPLGAMLLKQTSAGVFATGLGVFLIAYCTYTYVRPAFCIRGSGRALEPFVGFAGGATGSATAFPAAIPTIWCNARGLTKLEQRGLVQPYILLTQIAAIIYFSKVGCSRPQPGSLTSGACQPCWPVPSWASFCSTRSTKPNSGTSY